MTDASASDESTTTTDVNPATAPAPGVEPASLPPNTTSVESASGGAASEVASGAAMEPEPATTVGTTAVGVAAADDKDTNTNADEPTTVTGTDREAAPPATSAGAPTDLEAALAWHRPAIHGIGWIEQGYVGLDSDAEPVYEQIPGEVRFTRVSAGGNYPAAAAIATVVGYWGGSASYPLSRDDLERAANLLSGAGGGADLDVWREMLDTDDREAIYVFVGDPNRRSGDPYVRRLLDLSDSGRQHVPYGELRWWPAEDATTDPYPLIRAWTEAWPAVLPLAHELKEVFEDRWVRFHSLPESKRYADSPDEDEIVLRRHNVVLNELCAGVDEILVIANNVSSTPYPSTASPEFAELLPAHAFWTSVPWHYSDPDLLFAHLYASRRPWEPGALDDVLDAVAEEEMFGVIITPTDLRWLYHPYAGGADIILPTVAERDALAAAHAEWRSRHPSGL